MTETNEFKKITGCIHIELEGSHGQSRVGRLTFQPVVFFLFTFVKWFMHEHDNACVTLGTEWGCMGMVAPKRGVNWGMLHGQFISDNNKRGV